MYFIEVPSSYSNGETAIINLEKVSSVFILGDKVHITFSNTNTSESHEIMCDDQDEAKKIYDELKQLIMGANKLKNINLHTGIKKLTKNTNEYIHLVKTIKKGEYTSMVDLARKLRISRELLYYRLKKIQECFEIRERLEEEYPEGVEYLKTKHLW